MEIISKRYSRNLGTIGEDGQRRLASSQVAIAGAGGLGGVVFEILVRYGVGRIRIIDCDNFEPSNLNRQLLSSMEYIGLNKAVAAAERAKAINPEVEVEACAFRLTDSNSHELIEGADIACDCLGNIADRFILERAAKKAGIVLVHAAVAGTKGQLMTIFPEDVGFKAIYGEEKSAPESGEEIERGTPPSSVFTIAAMQAHEVVAVLTGIQEPLKNTILKIDLNDWQIRKYKIPRES